MKVKFEVPYGYFAPDTECLDFLPRKNDFLVVSQPKWHCTVALRVQKVCFDFDLQSVTIVLVEED